MKPSISKKKNTSAENAGTMFFQSLFVEFTKFSFTNRNRARMVAMSDANPLVFAAISAWFGFDRDR